MVDALMVYLICGEILFLLVRIRSVSSWGAALRDIAVSLAIGPAMFTYGFCSAVIDRCRS